MANLAVHFKSESSEWATPQPLFDLLNAEFHFTLDPVASRENAKCSRYFTREQDGLAQSWAGERVFLNPPYGREIGVWVCKAAQEAAKGALVVALLPARPDTQWWAEWVMQADEVRFLRGRVTFEGAPAAAPFPSAIVIWRWVRTPRMVSWKWKG